MQHIATHFKFAIELLDRLLPNPGHRRCTDVRLIVCSSQDDFIERLIQESRSAVVVSGQLVPPRENNLASECDHDGPQTHHGFLKPTPGLLTASNNIEIAYCPTLPILRACLSDLASSGLAGGSHVVILDLLALHYGTSEFTLQGLSRTMATAVSVTDQARSHLTLAECSDVNDPSSPDRGSRLWNVQIPLLSGSVKIGQEGSKWAGRGTEIRKIAARWFEFDENFSIEI